MEATRKLEFDAAHRVLGHESKCKNMHGHRYVAEVTIEAYGLDTLGRVIDFGVIKEKVGTWIDDNWDHNTILHQDDPLLSDGVPTPVLLGRMPFVMPDMQNPTAETMARFLFNLTNDMMESPLRCKRVRLYETPNCWSDYEG